MGKIYDEFINELHKIATEYRGQPARELDRLLQLALEREELVTTAYRASFLRQNIDRLQVDDDLKAIFRQAFIWIWKDEDMHTVYTRGALLKTGSYAHKIKTFISQIQGFIGGWSGSIVQHLSWKQAPVSLALAKLILSFGKISGKIPKEIRNELKHGTFKNFCAFNMDAENTAKVCWERIIALAKQDSRFNEEHVNDFQRIIFDETRHERVFRIIFDCLTQADALIQGITKEDVITQLSAVSDYFLPSNFRPKTDHPVGRGDRVWVSQNKSTTNKYDFFIEELQKTDLVSQLTQRAKSKNLPIENLEIVVKVSFSMGYNQEDLSPIADAVLIKRFAEYLYQQGFRTVRVIDIDSIYTNFYNNRSVAELARYFQFGSSYYKIINATEELEEHVFTRGIGNYQVSKSWKHADFRINFAKIKSHPTEMVLSSISNLEWLTGSAKEFVFVDRVVNRETTTCMLLDDFPPDFTVVEAYDLVPIGILGVMGCKKPINPKRFYFGTDTLSVDLTIAKHLKIDPIPEKSSLRNTLYWFGIEKLEYTIDGEDRAVEEWVSPTKNYFWAFLGLISLPVYQLLSNKGELFVPKMDTKNFPPRKRGGVISLLRFINRKITNLP